MSTITLITIKAGTQMTRKATGEAVGAARPIRAPITARIKSTVLETVSRTLSGSAATNVRRPYMMRTAIFSATPGKARSTRLKIPSDSFIGPPLGQSCDQVDHHRSDHEHQRQDHHTDDNENQRRDDLHNQRRANPQPAFKHFRGTPQAV